MAQLLSLASYRPKAWATMMEPPADRVAGGPSPAWERVLAVHWMFGPR